MAAVAERVTTIDLGVAHAGPDCLEMAWKLHRQLSDGYTHRVSAMPMPSDMAAYLSAHRTARKRAARAERLGYRFAEIDRHEHEDDVFAINTSMPERQGRPMSAGYHDRPSFGANPCRCDRHHVYTYGVLTGSKLVAYLWLYRCGELAMVSSILGHADHLPGDIMYLLVTEAIRAQVDFGGTLFYNLHSSGTDGLRYFKERIGFAPTEVEWLL
jgi:hypothetical protein